MKATGITRPVDELGRISLPIELRKTLDIKVKDRKTKEGDKLEIFVDEDKIILKKYNASCIFCGEVRGVKEFKGKKICKKCFSEMK